MSDKKTRKSPQKGRSSRSRNTKKSPAKSPKARKPTRSKAKSKARSRPQPAPKALSSADIRARGLELVEQARAAGEAVTLAVLDADDFSEVNEVFDLERGDRFLEALVGRLMKHPEAVDKPFGRLSGDLFLLILTGIEPEEAFLKVEALRAAVADQIFSMGRGGSLRKHALTISIGLAGFPKDGQTFAVVLSRALAALRRAKRLGKNRVGLPPDDNMVTKTSHFPKTQLEALRQLARRADVGEATLLREALEDLLLKYKGRQAIVKKPE